MKKTFFLVLFVLFANLSFAQEGINFYEGSWQETLTKAKQENKLVFVDVSTSWCGPCKKMAAEVFPQKEVGKVFNTAFVNYKIDAEEGEGIEIAAQFDVHAYPTYLFVDGEGTLVYRSGGYMASNKFIAEANTAIEEKKAAKPFVEWEEDYDAGNRDKDFLIGYLKKRKRLKESSPEIIEELFPKLSKEELSNPELLETILYYDSNIEYVPGGKFYKYIVNNSIEIDSLLENPEGLSLEILKVGLRNYFHKNIIKKNKEDMLPVMVNANRQISKLLKQKDGEITSKKIIMDYYAGTHNAEKAVLAAMDYVNNGLLKQDINKIKAADEDDFNKFMKPYLEGKKDSAEVNSWTMIKRLQRSNRMTDISYSLRNAAEAVYKNAEDKKALKEAAGWAKKADSWFPHFSTKAVYSGLLLKIGKKNDAVKMMGMALQDNFIQGEEARMRDIREKLNRNLKKINQGIAPDDLW